MHDEKVFEKIQYSIDQRRDNRMERHSKMQGKDMILFL